MANNVRGFVLGTDYYELEGDGCSLDKGRLTGTRVFRLVTYENYPLFLSCLGGGIEASGTTTNYTPPHQFLPDTQLWCQGARVEGIGGPTRVNGLASFSGGAKVTATYETLSYDPQTLHGNPNNPTPGVYVTESRSLGGRTIELTKKTDALAALWKFNGGINITDQNLPTLNKIEPFGEYHVTLHYQPTCPSSTLNGLIGKINNAQWPVKSSMGGFVSGTLLFLGDSTEREYTADGKTVAFQTTLNFSYLPSGWNYYYNSAAAAYQLVELISDGSKHPYEYADFTPLLRTT